MKRGNFVATGRFNADPQSELSTMECFDLLGPKTRSAINNAPVMFSPTDLFMNWALRRAMSDENLAELVRQWQRKIVAALEAERDAGTGIWSMKGFKFKTSRQAKADRWASPEFRREAFERALERSSLN